MYQGRNSHTPRGWFTAAWSSWHGDSLLTWIAFNKKAETSAKKLIKFSKMPRRKKKFFTRIFQARAYRGVVYGSTEEKGLNNTIVVKHVLGQAVS